MIQLSLNNQPVEIEENTWLQDALIHWEYGEQKLAVAINGAFVPRSQYAEVCLQDGDQLDIVKPVGGG